MNAYNLKTVVSINLRKLIKLAGKLKWIALKNDFSLNKTSFAKWILQEKKFWVVHLFHTEFVFKKKQMMSIKTYHSTWHSGAY